MIHGRQSLPGVKDLQNTIERVDRVEIAKRGTASPLLLALISSWELRKLCARNTTVVEQGMWPCTLNMKEHAGYMFELSSITFCRVIGFSQDHGGVVRQCSVEMWESIHGAGEMLRVDEINRRKATNLLLPTVVLLLHINIFTLEPRLLWRKSITSLQRHQFYWKPRWSVS